MNLKDWCLFTLIKIPNLFISVIPKVGGKKEILKPYHWQCPPLLDHIACCAFGRDTGKSSIFVEGYECWKFFNCQQSTFSAFDKKHLVPPMEGIIENYKFNPFLSQFVSWSGNKRGEGKSFQRDPGYQLRNTFDNFLYGRIPGPTGTGVLGLHVYGFIFDEMQDYATNAWNNAVKSIEEPDVSKGYHLKMCGVSNGTIKTPFYNAFHNPTSIFVGHRYNIPSFGMPDYSLTTYVNDLDGLGGYDGPDYVQNILGLWGTPRESLFPADLFEQCVDCHEHPTSKGVLNNNYRHFSVSKAMFEKNFEWNTFLMLPFYVDSGMLILESIEGKKDAFVIEEAFLSCDPAYSSIDFICVWFKIKGHWWNLLNLELKEISDAIHHAEVIHYLHTMCNFDRIMIDAGGGYGVPIIQYLEEFPQFSGFNYKAIVVQWIANKNMFFRHVWDEKNQEYVEENKNQQFVGIHYGKRDLMEKKVIFPDDPEIYRSITGVKQADDGSGRPESMTKYHAAAAFIGFEVCKALGLEKVEMQKRREYGVIVADYIDMI
jgi:hypothetical protein